MKCPLCTCVLSDPLSSPSIMIRMHLMLEHVAADQGVVHSYIKCLCGRILRGPTSLAKHITSLTAQEAQEHATIAALGVKALVISRTGQTPTPVGAQNDGQDSPVPPL